LITYGFYNSINNDRVYDAKDMSRLFDGIINDGVFMSIGDYFFVTPGTGLQVVVGKGRAWFNSSWTHNDALLPLVPDNPDLVLDRMDSIVIEINATEAIRANTIKIIKGTPATNPVPPTLIKTTLVNQYPLAHLLVKKGATAFTQADLTNKIGTDDCPFITGILQTIDSNALIAQWQSQFTNQMSAWTTQFNNWYTYNTNLWSTQFNNWFEEVQGLMGEDPGTALAQALYNHIHAAMPHHFMDGDVEYRYGFSVVSGVLTFNYEVVT